MRLLDEVIEASGGMRRWNELKRFSLQFSIDGALFSHAGQAGRCKDMVAEGSTRNQSVRFTGFSDPGKCGLYQPECVTIEGPEGNVLRSCRNPQQAFREHAREVLWDELFLVFFCGFSVWNQLMTPFLLAHSDVEVEELPSWYEHGQQWRRLRARVAPTIVTYCSEQIFYFDSEGRQRRTDHDVLGTTVAHYSWAHQAFCGIVVPTLRRSLTVEPDGTVITKPSLIDVEIFDASFE
jgi:hypothetical protein